MSDLYLIAHKVRGEPAFDVAIQIQQEEGKPFWIIPTSGHRAFPYAYWKIEDLFDGSDYPHARPLDYEERMPEGHPDHYAVNDMKRVVEKKVKLDADQLLEELGL